MTLDLSQIVPPTHWVCVSGCPAHDVTRLAEPHTRFHSCPAHGGMTMPLVREGERVKVVLNDREDYVGDASDDLTWHEGRPVMSVTTTRDDGEDVAVYAPTARGGIGG